MRLIPAFIHRRLEHRPNLLKIIDNIGWLFIDKILRLGVGLLIVVWLARYLGPEQFGLLSFATALVSMFGAIAALGLQGIVVRDIVRNPDCTNATLGTAAILQLISGLAAYIMVLVVVAYLRPNNTIAFTIVAILGSIMLLEASKIAAFWFESQVNSKYTVWVQNSVFLFFAAVKVLLILQQASLIAFVLVLLFEAVVVALIMMYIMGRHGPSLMKLRVSLERAKSLLKDSWPLIISGIAVTIYMKIDQIMLGQMMGNEVVGVYSAATRISEVWYFIPMVIMASLFPAIIKAKKRSKLQYYARLQKLYDLMVVISLLMALPMTFLSTPIIALLFGEAYLGAGPILAIHAWAAVFVFMGVVSSQWFLIENFQKMVMFRALLGAILNIVLNLILIPVFAAPGAALGTLLSALFVNFLIDLTSQETRHLFMMKLKCFNVIGLYKRSWKTP